MVRAHHDHSSSWFEFLRTSRRTRAALGLGLALGGLAWQTAVRAEDDPLTKVNKELTNPVPLVWSVKIKNEVTFLDGDNQPDRGQYELKLQPAAPILLTPDWKVIVRPEFTLIDDKPYTSAGASERVTAVGDTVLDLVTGPATKNWLLALGPTFTFPTASSEPTGQGKWEAGPAGVVGYLSHQWIAGLIAQQWWSFAGSSDRAAVSEMHLQYLATWFFPHGWSVGTSPTIKFNWRATPGNTVTFPVGLSVSKVVSLGALPVQFQLQGLYAPVRPDSNAEQFQIQFYIVPKLPAPLPDPLID